MKLIILILAWSFSGVASAASDYAVSWTLNNLQIGFLTYTRLDLDINLGKRYLAVNGGVATSGEFISPATGTCFTTNSGGLFCNLQVDQNSYNFEIGANLNGTLTGKDSLGSPITATGATFTGFK
jgi:hypothetical protein